MIMYRKSKRKQEYSSSWNFAAPHRYGEITCHGITYLPPGSGDFPPYPSRNWYSI